MDSPKTPLSRYQKQLLAFLSVATFFEGYDFLALAQILPNLRQDMGLDKGDAGWLLMVVNFGAVLSYLLVRMADRWGRRRMLTVTIAGYTLFTFLSGLAPEVISFAILQLVARTFLLAEWAISMVYAAEEFPADRRGMAIGVVSACSSLGAIVCAGVVPFLLRLPYGWRTVYFVGIVPLVLLAFARRNLRETKRFDEQARVGPKRSLFHIWTTPYRKRVIQLALIWGATYACTQNAVFFWKDFAVTERGFSDAQVGLSITLAALLSVPMVFAVGPFVDRVGRKRGAVVIFGLNAIGVLGSFTLGTKWALTGALVFSVFGVSAVLPVLNMFNTELFPTHLRGDAMAWANNLLGRITYVVSPAVVGVVARDVGWSRAVSATAVFPVLAVVLILVLLPETRARELEDTAAL
jgi:MFS transporter, putative metabolite:H+ symporter